MKKVKTSSKNRARAFSKKLIIILVVIVAVIALAIFLLTRGQKTSQAVQSQYRYDTAQLRDLTSTLTDSGSLEPANSYTVISLVSGEILSAGV